MPVVVRKFYLILKTSDLKGKVINLTQGVPICRPPSSWRPSFSAAGTDSPSQYKYKRDLTSNYPALPILPICGSFPMLTTCLSAPSVLYVPSILLTCHSAPSVSLFLPPIMLPNHNSSPSVCSICAFLPCFPPLVNHSAPFSPCCSSPSFPPPMLPLLPDHHVSSVPCAPINRVHAPRRSRI